MITFHQNNQSATSNEFVLLNKYSTTSSHASYLQLSRSSQVCASPVNLKPDSKPILRGRWAYPLHSCPNSLLPIGHAILMTDNCHNLVEETPR